MAERATTALFALLFSIAHADAASAQSLEATPQQAADFAKKKVEQYGSIPCGSNGNGAQALIEFNGSNLIIQSKSFGDNSAERTEQFTNTSNVPLDSIEQVRVSVGHGECGQKEPIVELVCSESSKCISWKNVHFINVPSNEKYNNRTDIDSGMWSAAVIVVSDDAMAQRIAKAIDFYRKAVASALSPF